MSAKKSTKPKLPKIPPLPDEVDHMDLSQNTLLSTLLNDPASRAMVLQFMSQAKKDMKYKEEQTKKVEDKLKKSRFMCESPTAQFRKKELARLESVTSDSESSTASSSGKNVPKVPFNKLLFGQVIYVEVFSNGLDKSLSAKALVQSMGAKVCDKITREVTHVIFKDGSYQTYQLARRLKMHVVSILWLQAVKRNGNLVPEKDYPAFGADLGDLNVSTMCKNLETEFDDVCQDEYAKINSSKNNSTVNKSLFNNTRDCQSTNNNITRRASTSRRKPLIENNSDEEDDSVFLAAKSIRTTTRSSVVSSRSSTQLPNKSSSDEGLIDGEASVKLNDSLELTSNIPENALQTTSQNNKPHRRRTLYNPENNSIIEINMSKNKRKTLFAVAVLKDSNRDSNNSNTSLDTTNKNSSKENTMEFTCFDDTRLNSTNSISPHINSLTNSNPYKNVSNGRSKISLESNSTINSSTRSSINSNSLDLTSFVSTHRRSVRIASKSEGIFKKPDGPVNDTESRETSFSEKLSGLRLSTESNRRQSTQSTSNRQSNESNKRMSGDNDLNLLSLRLSESQKANNTQQISEISMNMSTDTSDKHLLSDNLSVMSRTSSIKPSISSKTKINQKQSSENNNRTSNAGDSSNKRGSLDNPIQSEILTSLRLSDTQKTNNKSSTSELMGELSQLQIDTSTEKSVIEMSSLQLSESVKENSKKRLSDEEQQDLTPTKKKRVETAKPKQKSSASESSCSDGSGTKKSRKLYDVDDPSNDELMIHIESFNPGDPKAAVVKGRVKKAMELIAKPFELTPETNRGRPISISSDSGTESESTSKKNEPKKRLNKSRRSKANKNIAAVPSTVTLTANKASSEVFATPKTPKKPPSTPSRRSSRFVTPVTYKKFYDCSFSIDESGGSTVSSVVTPKLNRRSTMDFSTPMGTSPLRTATQRDGSASSKGSSRPGIACTRFKVGRVNTFSHIVRRLGRFHVDDNVGARTTHLVVGENKRTVNLLRAIARGCWILSADWLYKSMAAGKWLPEEDYEFTDFSEAVQFRRKEREAFGPTYTADIFASCGPIYVARRGTKPTRDELQELVRLAGGSLAAVARSATIVVGEVVRYDTVEWCVSELWLLDSITRNLLAECREYSLLAADGDKGATRERRLSEDY